MSCKFRLQEGGTFNWDSNDEGVILASFYYGYILTPFVSSVLAMKFGGKLLMLIGETLVAVLTVITPALTTVGGFPLLVTLRIMEGIGQVQVSSNIVAFVLIQCVLFNFIIIGLQANS